MGAAFSFPAFAQGGAQCGPREGGLRSLAEKYGEELVGAGLVEQGFLFELLVSQNGETWTLLMSFPDGISCVAAHGENWRRVTEPPVRRGQPS